MASKYQLTKLKTIPRKTRQGLLAVFVPHKANEFHPHLVKPLGLMVVIGIAVSVFVLTSAPQKGLAIEVETSGITRRTLLNESNKFREQNDVASLKINKELNIAAGLKARDMLARQYWAHTAPDGTTPWYWFREVKYRYDYAGENLAKGFQTSSGVMTAWMNSTEHRKNALSADYQEVGFGVADGLLEGEQTTIVVAFYGSPVGVSKLKLGTVLAATNSDIGIITRFGIGLQSMNPTALASIVLLGIAAVVALTSYIVHKRLPRNLRKSWKRHHALYKTILIATLILVLITLYGGGQIL